MKSFLKVVVVGSAVALAVAMIPSTSFAGERFDRGGRGDNGWSVFGRVVTAPLYLAANVIDHTVPRVGFVGPVGYCGPAPYGYCAPGVVVRPDVRYCAPVRYYGGRGYDRYDYYRR